MKMKKYSAFCLLALLTVLFTGCYGHRQVGLLQDRDDLPHYDSVGYQPYRMQVNDEIVYRIITLDETLGKTLAQNLSSSTGAGYGNAYPYRIYSDGTVNLPFLDPIRLEG